MMICITPCKSSMVYAAPNDCEDQALLFTTMQTAWIVGSPGTAPTLRHSPSIDSHDLVQGDGVANGHLTGKVAVGLAASPREVEKFGRASNGFDRLGGTSMTRS